jgi:hypothetical protein
MVQVERVGDRWVGLDILTILLANYSAWERTTAYGLKPNCIVEKLLTA